MEKCATSPKETLSAFLFIRQMLQLACQKKENAFNVLINYWSQQDTPPHPPMLHLWHKGHIALGFSSRQCHTPVPLRDADVTLFIISYWEAMREWIHLRGTPEVAPWTASPPPRPLCGIPREVSIKQPQRWGHFNPSSTSFISAPTPLEPRQWESTWIKPSLFPLCALVFYMEIRGAVCRISFLCLFRGHIETECF